ncbi:zinc finger MYM-type protein 4-like isoform X3 [Oncorhynchus keta]|uniref:zinc finger MYM-type protein 4-like isoform X3 n=1 Tax=Oncorhynchus keta TaxID=8018 RepID=UPI00227AF0F7|nr:zinc finger MYM-type protein 4-like isoform X3 [Oncorhynchus keta]
MAESQKADHSEHKGEPDKETEQPSQAGASMDSVDPGASHSNTASADGNNGDDATNAVSACSSSIIDGAGDAGNSGHVRETDAEDSQMVEETVKTDALLTVVEMDSKEYSQTERETASVDVPQTERETAGVDVPQTERETVSGDASQTEIETASVNVPQTERETVSADASQTARETVSADASQTEIETASVDVPQTEIETASADVSQTERETVSADASQTERETACVDASQTERETACADASQMERKTGSADASQTERETACADTSQTDRETARADASLTDRETARADASQTDRETARADATQTDRETARADASQTDRETARADASQTDRETARADASQTDRETARADASQTDRETACADASQTERETACADASQTERETACADASQTERETACADASQTDRETARADASQTDRETARADASQTDRETARADASQTDRETARADASQTDRETARADASQTDRETARADASQTDRETARADASQTDRETARADASQTDRETARADASQTDRETTRADASQTETARADASQTETARTDAPQTVEEIGSTSGSQTNGETDIPLDMGVVDADDEMEVNAIKVEDDQMQEEDNLEGMPVITAVEEGGNMVAFSSNSLDHGDEVEKMDTGTDSLTENEVEEPSKTGQVEKTNSIPSVMDTVSMTGDTEQPAEETSFVKASSSSLPMEEDQSEDVKPFHPSSTTSSEAIHPQNSEGIDCPAGLENGVAGQPVKVVASAQLAAEPVSTSAETISMVKVKDEPVDEEYDQALAPAVLSEGVKDEPDSAEELKISNVFSVGSCPTTNAVSTPVAALPKTVIPAPASSSIPPLIPMAMRVACSACKKVLLKGQTAYQRKGSSDLFCSTSCLTSYSPPPVKMTGPAKKPCHYCLKEIANPKDVITAPVDTMGTVKDFCSQTCLSSFNFKRNSAVSTLSSSLSTMTGAVKCSMCKKACVSKHEVIFQGSMHKLCSEVCFTRFRSTNKLSMNSCQSCNNYCYGKVTVLVVQGVNKTFCSDGCVATFKQKAKKPVACTMCRNFRSPVEMIDSADSDGKLEMFCSTGCVTAHKVQTVSSSGARVECNTCGQKTVPSFHLAMSDGSIRNFCTMTCVVTFQDQFNKSNSQSQINVAPSTGSTAPPAAQTRDMVSQGTRLPCFHCHRLFSSKPELIQFKDKMVFLCSVNCSEEYKKINCEMARCEYCKIEKPAKEVKRINKRDYTFCSEGCKLLYKHDLTKRWGKHCKICAYCASTAQKAVTGQYGGKLEDFCSDECKSHYTLLFCQVAKCDACERQGKLIETLPMLGEVKHFCNLQCLLQFCSLQTQSQGKPQGQKVAISIAPSPSNTTTATSVSDPVIANVISLASSPTGQPNYANTSLQGTVPSRHVKYVGNASTQTQAPRAPPPRAQKNKALLCKPMVQNKGIMCKPNFTTTGCQTDDDFPKVIIVPVPVPVYVPVPMNLYTQYTPQPVGLPIPLPVPMFLPVTLDNAERIVETIQDIKEKIPSDPFEADLILMAEMVADEGREKSPERPPERPPAPVVQDDQVSTYSGDLDTDELSNFLTTWDDEPPPTPGISSRHSRPYAHETLRPIVDINVPATPPPPIMDIEADFPVQTLELMAHWRDQERDRSPSPPPSPPRRRARRKARDGLPQKKKKRKSKAAETASVVPSLAAAKSDVVPGEPPKLQHMYGVDAWKRWVQWSKTQPDLEKPRFGSRPMEIKEDVLKCTTAELSYGLCRFICEVKRPNGESYSQDSLFYLCLGVQQYLFQNGRMENIFTDLFYGKFTLEITKLLKDFKPTITASGYLHSRVEEEYLWDCKQLGAYSPIVLLNTLLFFCTKFFQFKTVAQHRQLSFAHVMRCTKSIHDNTKSNFLRFYPPIPKKDLATETAADADGVAAKRKREDEEKEEVRENSENPPRCPVRLYEFYLW